MTNNYSTIFQDGNNHEEEGGTNFVEVILQALRRGWQVEIWSWERSISQVYYLLRKENEGLSIHLLDEYRNMITFRSGDNNFPGGMAAATLHSQRGGRGRGRGKGRGRGEGSASPNATGIVQEEHFYDIDVSTC